MKKLYHFKKWLLAILANIYGLFFSKKVHWRECVKDFIFNPPDENILKWTSYGPTKVTCTKVNNTGIYITIYCIRPSVFIGYHGKNIGDFQAALSRKYNTRFKITVTEDFNLVRTRRNLVKMKFNPKNLQ